MPSHLSASTLRRWTRHGTFVAAWLCACAPDGNESLQAPAREPRAIVGGFEAPSDAFLAVGTLSVDAYWPPGKWAPASPPVPRNNYCSGTLIGPSTVLTSRECAVMFQADLGRETIMFGVGPSVHAHVRLTEIAAAELPSYTTHEGVPGVEANLGVLYLDQPVPGVAPMRLGAVDDRHIDQAFVALGYGSGGIETLDDKRRAGQVHLNARTGSAMEIIYGDWATFFRSRRGVGEDLTCATDWSQASCQPDRDVYLARLEQRSELLVGLTPGDARPCGSDRGGPLIRADGAALGLYGVMVQWLRDKDEIRSSTLSPCGPGAIYAALDTEALTFLRGTVGWTDPCGETTASGQCVGAVAQRCVTSPTERSVATVDCSLSGRTCGTLSNGTVGCLKP